jgi:hypothetical protein
MAVHEVPSQAINANPALASAYFKGALALEDLTMSLERVPDTAYMLARADDLDSDASAAFYTIAEMVGMLGARAKTGEDELTELSAQYR